MDSEVHNSLWSIKNIVKTGRLISDEHTQNLQLYGSNN